MPAMHTVLQWEIYDAYIADQEKQRIQEELNKQKAAAKKATAAVEAAETSQDPAKVCCLLMHFSSKATKSAFSSCQSLSCSVSMCIHKTLLVLGMMGT